MNDAIQFFRTPRPLCLRDLCVDFFSSLADPRLVLFAALFALAMPAAAQTYAITGARIYTLAGPPIEGGTVVIKDGKIAAVGKNVSVPGGARVIDGKGLEVYPGFFDSVSEMGLVEIDAVPATVDTQELGEYNPQLVAATAVHPASEHIPVARANGVTHAVSVPGMGGSVIIGGQASAIHLNGWVMDEMAIRRAAAMTVNWPTLQTGGGGFGGFGAPRRPFTEVKQEYEKRVAALGEWLDRARHYAQAREKGSADKFERDLKLEALVPVIKGELPLLVLANSDRDIKNAIEFCEKQKVKLIIAGGRQAWKVKDLLKQKNVPVILRSTQSLPVEEDDPYDKPYTQPGELHAAGVKIAFATFGGDNSAVGSYAVANEAGNAVAYGLPREEALKAITLYPAQMYGLGDKLGSIEAGKIANLVVTTGDALELRTQIRYVFVNGVQASTDNKHKQLYEKYRARP